MSADWELIEDIAKSLGVGPHALKKWRWRGSVPRKWQLPIIRNSDGRLSLDAFDKLDEGARA